MGTLSSSTWSPDTADALSREVAVDINGELVDAGLLSVGGAARKDEP
jgi:hypothetical protein